MRISGRTVCQIAICLMASLGACGLHAAQTSTSNPSLHQLPPEVQKAVKTELGDDRLIGIEKEDEDGEVSYTITRAVKDGERFFTMGSDGRLLSREISLDEAPPAVQKTIKTQLGQGTIESIEKSFEDGEISFDVEMKKKDGAESSFNVAPDGKLTCAQIALAEIPGPARKTIEAHVGNGKLGDIYRLIDGDDVLYDAEVNHGGKTRDVVAAPNGKLESIQVFLDEVPAEAQMTIRERLGNGKLVRIDKSFTPRHGVEPFEVESRKEGKPFNFSVAPKGRFLGMD